MKEEYDFSKAERGKFYRPNATLNLPVYLDEDVREYFSIRAKAKGIDVQKLINELLRKDMALIQEVSG
ncbi:MAG: hypothetical protein JG718_02415 [Candidatus Thiothrix moscowensis]|nr:hypothetical protein [Candidatus Thiothrix moscowensis]